MVIFSLRAGAVRKGGPRPLVSCILHWIVRGGVFFERTGSLSLQAPSWAPSTMGPKITTRHTPICQKILATLGGTFRVWGVFLKPVFFSSMKTITMCHFLHMSIDTYSSDRKYVLSYSFSLCHVRCFKFLNRCNCIMSLKL